MADADAKPMTVPAEHQSTDSRAWSRWLRTLIVLLVVFGIAIYGSLVLIDPFSTAHEVLALTTERQVGTASAEEPVGAVITVQRVWPSIPVQDVTALVALEEILVGPAPDDVRADTAVHLVNA